MRAQFGDRDDVAHRMSPTIAKARQFGFSTEICMLILDDCLFRKNTGAAIIDATIGDAKKKLAKIKFAYDRLPPVIGSRAPRRRA
jgi:hypothetical protein